MDSGLPLDTHDVKYQGCPEYPKGDANPRPMRGKEMRR